MIKDHKKFIEHYEKLYEELKKKYENKEKENEQLKTLLKLRDKEIISLKTKIKSLNNNSDSKKENSPNNNNHEISKTYLENLIKNEMENIKKDLLLYRNKILTLENYELQYLAPKLTTGSNNNNYQYSSKRFLNKSINFNNDVDKLYLNMKQNKRNKTKLYHSITKTDVNLDSDAFDSEFNNVDNMNTYGLGENIIMNDSFRKTLTKSKRHYDI
jgi:hypothetical protein